MSEHEDQRELMERLGELEFLVASYEDMADDSEESEKNRARNWDEFLYALSASGVTVAQYRSWWQKEIDDLQAQVRAKTDEVRAKTELKIAALTKTIDRQSAWAANAQAYFSEFDRMVREWEFAHNGNG
jgi:hypothetical protein